jgi:predicted permease
VASWEDFSAIPLRDALVGDIKPALQMLTAAVALVLIIGCANVANLLLARGHRRRTEIATRTALGAGRARVVRQLLAESGLLAAIGGVTGLATGYAALLAIERAGSESMPRLAANAAGLQLDSSVVFFALTLTLQTGVLFGLLPALSTSRVDLSAAFKDAGSAAGAGWRRHRLQAVLVTLEMTLALVLLVGSGLMIRTVIALRQVDRGFDPARVLTLETSLSGTSIDTSARVQKLFRNGRLRLDGVGGVVMVAASRSLPLDASFALPFTIPRRPVNAPFEGAVNWRSITSGYFDVFRMPIRRGRAFTDRDDAGGPPVVIVNRALARKYWQRNDPVGERITIGAGAGPEFADVPRQIVGVVTDARDAEANREPEPMVYVPLAQVSDAMTARNNRLFPLTWVIRTDVDPRGLTAVARREVRDAAGGLPVARARTMEEILAAPARRAAFTMTLLTAFAGIAVLLAMIGLYGLMSYSVQQRSQEIGIRMALGAVPSDVRNLVMVEGLRLALAGVALGVGVALVLTRLMSSLVFGIATYDPGVFAAVVILLTTVALAAAVIPAHRATRLSPLDAVRRT